MSSRDNPFVRFAAFWWGIGVILLFFVILLVTRAIVGGGDAEDPLEETARKNRLKTLAGIEAAQQAYFEAKVVEEGKTVQLDPEGVFEHVGSQLLAAQPSKVDDPAQVVPGSAAAEALATAGGEADTEGVDALTPEAGTEPDPAMMEKGKQQYMVCMACHGMNGEGGPVGPPLANSDWVAGPVSNLIRIQMRGLEGPITVSGKEYTFPAPMAPMGAAQSDEDVASVLTYIRNSFGNSAPPVLPEQVKMLRSEIGKPPLTQDDLIPVAPGS